MSKTTEAAKTNKAIVVDSIASLIAQEAWGGRKIDIEGFYADTPFGFKVQFTYDSTKAKNTHNGFSIINPDHLSTTGSANWYTSDGDSTDDTGNGCWVRDVGSELRLTEVGITIGTGQTATVVTNNTKAVQTWINALSNLDAKGIADFYGVVETNKIYGYYDATNNPDFNPSQTSKIRIEGYGNASNNRENEGTVFVCVETGAIEAFEFGDGSTPIRGLQLKNVTFRGNNSGRVVFVNYASQQLDIDNLYVEQDGTGDGLIIHDAWSGSVRNIFCKGAGSATSGVGFNSKNVSSGAGGLTINNVTGQDLKYGVVLGGLSTDEGSLFASTEVQFIQGSSCEIGIFIGTGCLGNNFSNLYTENCTKAGTKICNFARNTTITSIYGENPTATEGDFVIGLGTVDDYTKTSTQTSGDSANGVQNGVVSLTLTGLIGNSVNSTGIKYYASANTVDIDIIKPRLVAETSGVGTGIDIPNLSGNGFSVYRPIFVNLATDINNADDADEIVYSGELSGRIIRGNTVISNPATDTSQSAISVGSVVGVEEIYDENESSLGYRPIYGTYSNTVAELPIISKSAAFTLTASDFVNGKVLYQADVSTAFDITVPQDSDEDIPNGSIAYVEAQDAQGTVVAGTGATLNPATEVKTDTSLEAPLIAIVKVAADTWQVYGGVS